MTLIEAINKVDALKPNTYTIDEKISWLSQLDGMVKSSIIDTHEDGDDIEYSGYDNDTALTTELLIKSPYDEVYIVWLESKIDYANSEYTKYNNSVTRFNDLYQEYRNAYNREHMPIKTAIKYY